MGPANRPWVACQSRFTKIATICSVRPSLRSAPRGSLESLAEPLQQRQLNPSYFSVHFSVEQDREISC